MDKRLEGYLWIARPHASEHLASSLEGSGEQPVLQVDKRSRHQLQNASKVTSELEIVPPKRPDGHTKRDTHLIYGTCDLPESSSHIFMLTLRNQQASSALQILMVFLPLFHLHSSIRSGLPKLRDLRLTLLAKLAQALELLLLTA